MERSYMENKERNFFRYLGFCYRFKEKVPNLDAYLDYSLFMAFLDYLDQRAHTKGQKEARPSNKLFHVAAAIAAVKYLSRSKNSARNWGDIGVIQDYQQLLSQLESHKKANYPPLTKSQIPKWVELPEIRAAWKLLEEEVDQWEDDDLRVTPHLEMLQHARIYQKYVIMSLWLSMPPVRSQILRDLIFSDVPPNGEAGFPNALYWDKNKENYHMWVPRQKNSKRGGFRQAFSIALPKATLGPILDTFLTTYWPLLQKQALVACNSKTENSNTRDKPDAQLNRHLFLDTKGNGFSKQNFARHTQAMWEKYTESRTKMPAKLIRDIVVTDLGDRGVAEAVWESYAFMMSHSRQTQRQVYDKRNHMQRAFLALDDIAQQNKDAMEVDFADGGPTPTQVGAAVQAAQASQSNNPESIMVGTKRKHPPITDTIKDTESEALNPQEEPKWDVKCVLERQPSKKRHTGGWNVLCQWENTWEPISHLPLGLKKEAMQLPVRCVSL
jgi:hypothetical protein